MLSRKFQFSYTCTIVAVFDVLPAGCADSFYLVCGFDFNMTARVASKPFIRWFIYFKMFQNVFGVLDISYFPFSLFFSFLYVTAVDF